MYPAFFDEFRLQRSVISQVFLVFQNIVIPPIYEHGLDGISDSTWKNKGPKMLDLEKKHAIIL